MGTNPAGLPFEATPSPQSYVAGRVSRVGGTGGINHSPSISICANRVLLQLIEIPVPIVVINQLPILNGTVPRLSPPTLTT